MKHKEFVMYPVHIVLLNFSVLFRERLIYNENILVGFLRSQ